MLKDCKYPIFLECSKYTLDSYWVDVFHNCSLGKFPKRMTLMDGTIRVSIDGKKKFEFFETKDDPKEMFQLCMDIFKNKMKLKSLRDYDQNVKDFESNNQDEDKVYERWDEVKPKSIKEKFINEFVIRKKSEYKLSYSKCIDLGRIIRTGILFKIIKSENIIFTNKIENITNLIYHKDKGYFTLNGDIFVKLKKEVSSSNENPLKKRIEKYILQNKNF